MTAPAPPPGSRPPASDQSGARGLVIKGIAGSPGVAVGPALVIGDNRAVYPRRTVPQEQVRAELDRLNSAVEGAKQHIREVSARLPSGPLETNRILETYLAMVCDPMLLARIEKKIQVDRKCAEWAVAQACDEIAKLFEPDAQERDAYIVERKHDIEFVSDRLLRELTGDVR